MIFVKLFLCLVICKAEFNDRSSRDRMSSLIAGFREKKQVFKIERPTHVSVEINGISRGLISEKTLNPSS